MKKIICTILAIVFSVASVTVAQEGDVTKSDSNSLGLNLREVLVKNELTGSVLGIDEYYTHVFPDISSFGFSALQIPKDFTALLINSCDTKWMVKGYDPFTSKVGWVPYDGKSNLYSREIEDKVKKTNETVKGALCVNRFEIVDVWGTWREASAKGYHYFLPQNFIIKHNTPQPRTYKNSNIPSTIDMLPAGDIKNLKPEESTKGFFAALTNGGKPDSSDIFQYLTLLCAKNNGKIRGLANEGIFVPDLRGGRMKDGVKGYLKDALFEVSLLELYRHAFGGGFKNTGLEKEWYFACEGDLGFLARVRENIIRDSRGKYLDSNYTAIFAPDRGLDGIDYSSKKHKRLNNSLL